MMHITPLEINQIAQEAGYDEAYVTDASPFDDYRNHLRKVAGLTHDKKTYEPFFQKADPCRTAPWCRSVVVCLYHYNRYTFPSSLTDVIGRHYLWDRRVSLHPDHRIPKFFKDALKKKGIKVKKGGTPDRAAAFRSGAGTIGKNGFFYSRAGSWVNIETYRISAEINRKDCSAEDPDPLSLSASNQNFFKRCPPGCDKCIRACPTGALIQSGCVDMTKCIAWLTYEGASPESPVLKKNMKTWVYGCDECQTVCPLNRDTLKDASPSPWMEKVFDGLSLKRFAEMDRAFYESRVIPFFWYLGKDGLGRWHLNARRALKNLSGRLPAS